MSFSPARLTARAVAPMLLGALAVVPAWSSSAHAGGPSETSSVQVSAKPNKGCITRKEYLEVKVPMRMSRVQDIIGSKGEIMGGDIGLHVRLWVSCKSVDDERMPVCMTFARQERPDGTFKRARLEDKDVDCPSY